MEFAPLHIYSGFSFLRSGFTLPRLTKKALSSDFEYIGLSDFQTMAGYPEFFHGLEFSSKHPVFGYDTVIEEYGFSLFVKSEEGYRNLLTLCVEDSKGNSSLKLLKEHQSGLAVVLQTEKCPLPIQPYDEEELRNGLQALSKGLDDFRLGLPYGNDNLEIVNNVRNFVAKYPYPTIAFPFIAYEKKEDAIVLSIVRAISSEEQLNQKTESGDCHWLSEEELSSFYQESELKESILLAKSTASFSFLAKRGGLLHFPLPEGESSTEQYLRKLAYEGLNKKNPGADKRYTTRLDYELGVIHQMGYDDYFLIVADYVRFSKTHGIPVGPGRGSGAGSLVSYCLDIVRPDPIKYDLLFERFLNPMRSSMPDIDVDFGDTKRDLVVTYLIQKYGVERVGHIITMQTLGAKASLRDVGRVFNYPNHDIDVLAKAITLPYEDLRSNYKKSPEFRQIVDSDPYYLEIVSLASKIEGLPRQSGLHAAGIVLNDSPLSSSIPTKEDEFSGSVVEFEMNYLEEQGFLKMDILGLRNLTIIEHCLDLLERKGISLYYEDIPYEDKDAIALIASNRNMGIFQLESPGMNRAIATVKPTTFEDVVAILALFRPGPMDNIPSFARRKHGLEKIVYPHPKLERILSSTYGIIVYQEQIMLIATELAGMDLGQADLFRRAISKKNAAKLESLRGEFLAGCKRNGIDDRSAIKVFELIERFANYGFNKSHALSYAIIACQMAYLKAHYPQEFYCAILDGTSPNDPKFKAMVSEMKRSSIRLTIPSVNAPSIRFEPSKEGIRFPLNSIKGIQYNLTLGIVEEFKKNGPYLDIFDFAKRVKKHGLNQSSLVKLIEAGALDCLDSRRASLALASSSALSYAQMLGGDDGETVLLDFDFPKPEIIPVNENKMTDLLREREALGLMVSGSPLDELGKGQNYKKLTDIDASLYKVDVIGIVSSVKVIVSKKGAKMAFLLVYDEESEKEFTVFASEYDKGYPYMKEGNPIVFTAHKENYQGRISYVAENIRPLEDKHG